MKLLSGQESKFGAGYYEYPFSFQLPHQLPTSFEGQHGNVRYFVRAKAERPWAFDYEFKAGFSVNTFVDLNQIPAAAVSFPLHRNPKPFITFAWICFSIYQVFSYKRKLSIIPEGKLSAACAANLAR